MKPFFGPVWQTSWDPSDGCHPHHGKMATPVQTGDPVADSHLSSQTKLCSSLGPTQLKHPNTTPAVGPKAWDCLEVVFPQGPLDSVTGCQRTPQACAGKQWHIWSTRGRDVTRIGRPKYLAVRFQIPCLKRLTCLVVN